MVRRRGSDGGVVFIPAQVAERDVFGHRRLREGKYTAGQIDTGWTAAIETDFTA
jgi:hypothetical protein